MQQLFQAPCARVTIISRSKSKKYGSADIACRIYRLPVSDIDVFLIIIPYSLTIKVLQQ